MKSKWVSGHIVRGVVASAFVLLGAGIASANQFVGDLVYCEKGGVRGVYEPEAGDVGLNGVGINVHCTDANNNVCDIATTTGAYHSSVDVGTYKANCSSFVDYDIADATQLTGRYAVNLLGPGGCSTSFQHPVSCTVTVDPNTLPANCDVLVSPTITPALPADGNGDGDWCDAEDGPFVEGQILGDNGADQATCEAAPSIPGDGVHEYHSNNPPSSTRCSVFDDFAFEQNVPECVPCVPRYHGCAKNRYGSWSSLFNNPHPNIPTCPYGVGTDPNRTYTPTTSTYPPVTYCPIDDNDPDDHNGSHHGNHHKHKKWKFGWSGWGWGWGWKH